MAAEVGAFRLDDEPPYRFCGGEYQYQLSPTGGVGDELRIDGILLKIGARSGTISQTVTRVADNAIIADATLTFVCIDLVSQRALPLEGPLLEHLDAIRQA